MNNEHDTSNNPNPVRRNFVEISDIGSGQQIVTFGGTLDYLLNRAREFMEQGDFQIAFTLLTGMEHGQPDNQIIIQTFTTALLVMGKFTPAREKASRLVELWPDNAASWVLLGFAHDGLGERQLAIEAFDIALQAGKPDAITIAVLLGLAIKIGVCRPELEEMGKQAVRMAPDSQFGWLVLASLQMRLGKLAEARANLEKGIRINPDSPSGRVATAILTKLNQH